MAATPLLAVGTGTTPSTPFTVAADERVGLLFRPGSGTLSTHRIALVVQNSNAGWDPVATFGPDVGINTGTLTMPGTYRFERPPGVNAGMDRT